MLSFLQEDKNSGGNVAANQQSEEKDGSRTFSIEAGQPEFLTVASKSSNVRKSTIALAVLFVIGLLSIVLMIKKSTPATVSATTNTLSTEEAKIEAAIANLSGAKAEFTESVETVVSRFYGVEDMPQVAVDELAKNPFRHELSLAGGLNSGQEDADKLEMMRRLQMEQQMKGMRLLSIMNSDNSKCCMIDDRILYVGDSIKGLVVSEISADAVKLISGEMVITLELEK